MHNYPTFVHSRKDIPMGEHYVILEFSSFYVPGDQRSRDAPGHGYPEHDEQTVSYNVYASKDEWEAEIVRRTQEKYPSRDWAPLICRKAEIEVKVLVNVK